MSNSLLAAPWTWCWPGTGWVGAWAPWGSRGPVPSLSCLSAHQHCRGGSLPISCRPPFLLLLLVLLLLHHLFLPLRWQSQEEGRRGEGDGLVGDRWFEVIFFFICMSIMWIYVMSHVCQAGRPASCLTWQNLSRWTLDTNFSTHFFIPAMLIGTTNFYYFIPLSLSSTLPGGHEVSSKQNCSVSFQLIRMKFDNKRNNFCFTDCIKKM